MRTRNLVFVCLLCSFAVAQAYQPFNNPHEQFLDKPLPNGKICT